MLLPVALEARSEPVGVQHNRLYGSVAGHDTSQLVQFGIGGGRPTRDRAPAILFAQKQPTDVDM